MSDLRGFKDRLDARGNLIQTTRDGAYTTTYAYDRFGQRIAMTDTPSMDSGQRLGLVTRYQYDELGRTAAVTTPHGVTRPPTTTPVTPSPSHGATL